MPARVGEGAERAVVIAEHDRGHLCPVDRAIVPGLGDIVGAADQVPVDPENAFPLARKKGRVGVARGRQRLGFEEGEADPGVARGIEQAGLRGRGLRHWIAAKAGSSASKSGRARPSFPSTTSRARRT